MGQRPRDGTTLCRQANRRACPGDGHQVSRRPAQRDRGDHCYYSDRLLGDALVAWRLPAIESIEAQLKDAIAALQIDALPPLEVSTRRLLITELANVANALSRCQRLGASFAELIQFQTYALGGTESYDAVGQKRTSGSASMLRVRA